MALLFHWVEVPIGFESGSVIHAGSKTSTALKVILFTILIAVFSLQLKRRSLQRHLHAYLAVILATVLFSFPGALHYFEPELSGQASWLEQQHKNLSWLGGDVFTSQEERISGNHAEIYVVDTFRFNSPTTLPKSIPQLIQWGRLAEWIHWAGYTNAFCQFVSKGWFLGWFGCLLIWIYGIRGQDNLHANTMNKSLALLCACSLLPLLLIGMSVSGAAWSIGKAHVNFQHGRYALADQYLAGAEAFMPILTQDSYIMAQKGLIHRKLQKITTEHQLYDAFLLERAQLYQQAQAAFITIALDTPRQSGPHREALRGILRAAIQDWNSQQITTAQRHITFLLEYDPCSLKGNYVGQLVSIRSQQIPQLRDLVERMETVYAEFNSLTPKPVVAMARSNLEFAELKAKSLTP